MLAKIKWFQVAIILVVLTILSVAAIFIFLIKPVNERYDLASTKLEAQTTALATAKAQKPKEEADRVKARAEVAAAQRDWSRYKRQYMPEISLANRFTGTQQLWNEQINVIAPKVLKFLYADRSVRIVTQAIKPPTPPADPNTVVQKVFTYPFGNVTVAGTFDQVLRHTERWNRFDRLALIDGLVLSGNSPTLTGTYTLTIYEVTNFDKVGAPIPQASPGTGGAGGFPGGPPGNLPSGPPPGFPGVDGAPTPPDGSGGESR